MKCSKCGTEAPLYGHGRLCSDCYRAAIIEQARRREKQRALAVVHDVRPFRERRIRGNWTIDGRNPDHVAPGEEF